MDDIQTAAQKAFKMFSQVYHTEPKKEYCAFVEKMLNSASKDQNVAVTRGYTRGLTSLNKLMLKKYVMLCAASDFSPPTQGGWQANWPCSSLLSRPRGLFGDCGRNSKSSDN